ncbi:hypothetical protein [Pseudomonas farsensis]|uniref:Uncharacterized protein n=1 Tax=Pseudomonas farsensis TaxID=2745492 RepID=A0ABU8QLW7_9PSED
MIVVCSGEGVSDLGACSNQLGVCQDASYKLGPLAIVVDSIIEEVLAYSPKETHPSAYRYYSETYLEVRLVQRKKERRGFVLAGRKHGIETGLFYSNAWMLGEIAKELEVAEDDSAIAVLFRDTDGGNSATRDLWLSKHKSMCEGFKRAEFTRGVPMVPRPKSEAWFLCAAKENPYQHCAVLEELSGNDKSPKAVKDQLEDVLGYKATAGNLLDWLENNPLRNAELASQMPSFSAFRERMEEVLQML